MSEPSMVEMLIEAHKAEMDEFFGPYLKWAKKQYFLTGMWPPDYGVMWPEVYGAWERFVQGKGKEEW